jgi:hypothetical protein
MPNLDHIKIMAMPCNFNNSLYPNFVVAAVKLSKFGRSLKARRSLDLAYP